jgi:hypothetical protein
MITAAAPAFLTLGTPACRPTDIPLFDSRTPADEEAAVAICHRCPLRQPCATYALADPDSAGTWGGLTAEVRLQLRRGTGWWLDADGRPRVPCGTPEALGAHRRYAETCPGCEAAHDARTAAARRKALAREHDRPRGGSRRGYELHRLLGEEPCVRCATGHRASARRRATVARQRASQDLAA